VQVLSEIPNKQIESYVAAGKVRLLAVADDKRMKEFPNVPTTAEAGFPDIRLSHWAGIFATKGTPDAVLDKLNAEIQAAIQTDAFKAGAAQQNAVLLVGNRAEFTRQIRSEADTLGKIASELKIIAE
jgi:tripartite-type tricarboxylate transporter receptor subunit TctC